MDTRNIGLRNIEVADTKICSIDGENGKLIYSFAITVPGKSGVEEVNVNAIDGSVVGTEHESAKTEKAEAAKEAKEAKPKKTATKK